MCTELQSVAVTTKLVHSQVSSKRFLLPSRDILGTVKTLQESVLQVQSYLEIDDTQPIAGQKGEPSTSACTGRGKERDTSPYTAK